MARSESAKYLAAVICHLDYDSFMNWKHLLQIVGDEPLFETGLLLAGDIKPANVTHQLSRWTISGLLRQVRKGLYVLPSANYVPHPFLIANRLVKPSYVSLQSALALYGLIPEYVPVTTSVTTERPDLWDTSIGRYTVQHVKLDLFDSYRLTDLGPRQTAFIALPDKALLDLIYLLPGGDDPRTPKKLHP
jgi:hypothetical protein